MSTEDRLRQAAEREAQSARLRERFGMTGSSAEAQRVTDGMTGAGAVLVTLAVIVLAVGVVLAMIFGG
jgi:hypothetical protein